MFRLAADVQVYLHREAIDFRVGINGLAILVEQAMHLDPFGRAESGRRWCTAKVLDWLLSGTLRSMVTNIICSIRRRGGLGAPSRWLQRCSGAP